MASPLPHPIPTPVSPPNPSQIPTAVKHLKLVIFPVGKLNLALPIETVVKVVNRATIHGSGLNAVGITHIDDREITVLDLHQRLFNASPQTIARYLLIGQNPLGERFGIPVDNTPSLMEVPLPAIRQLPDTYRRADTLKIADRVAVIQQNSASMTLFLLDVSCLLPPESH